MVGIIDYDAGNVMSVKKAVAQLGRDVCITRDRDVLMNADHVILPGVGAFGDCMDKLNSYDLVGLIRDITDRGTPFLGICLGLQLLFDESEEAPGVKGLGILPGKIVRFDDSGELKVPHMGWNQIEFRPGAKLFKGVEQGSDVYFVHSYYLKAEDRSDVAAVCRYGVTFDASVEHENIFACQFHPEKSSRIGMKILENFLNLK